MFSQETTPPKIDYIEPERPPTDREIRLWNRAQEAARRTNLKAFAVRLQYSNILLTYSFAQSRKIYLSSENMPEMENRMYGVLSDIERIKDDMCDVNQLSLGIRISSGGNDLDIISPESQTMGWVIPAIVGAVIVAGIIARWAYLESEVDEISAHYNGILRRTDLALCSDPKSQQCQDWKKVKREGGYIKRVGIIDSVKSAVKRVGTIAGKGLGTGIALAVPLAIMFLLPKKGK